jgi:hypothetical protein
MKKFLIATSMAGLFLMPSLALSADKPSAEQCKSWLEKVDVNKDGDIGNNEDSKKYVDLLTGSGHEGMGEDAVVKGQMFLDECAKGVFGMPAP